VTITGLGFDLVAGNNTVVFNDGAVGTVTNRNGHVADGLLSRPNQPPLAI